jgi:hypothetical protein
MTKYNWIGHFEQATMYRKALQVFVSLCRVMPLGGALDGFTNQVGLYKPPVENSHALSIMTSVLWKLPFNVFLYNLLLSII